MKNTLKQTAVFRYRVGFIRNGVRHLKPWRNNLILDSGLDKVATVQWANCFTNCLFGNQVSPEPSSRASGTTTFTVTGTTCVASGSYFQSDDVGRLIKFDGVGGEYYIQSYTSATQVTLTATPSPAITAETGTIWYVNRSALQSLHSTTATYDTSGGACGTTDVANVRTMKRTFVGAAAGSPVTLTEIGFNNSASNSSLFDRDIIPGTLSLLTGDQPTAICELVVTISPNASTAAGNVATGFDSSGNYIACRMDTFSYVAASGATATGSTDFEPSQSTAMVAASVDFTFPTGMGNFSKPTTTGVDGVSLGAYTNGQFYRDKLQSFSTGVANHTIYAFIVQSGGGLYINWVHKFTTPFTKTSAQTLSFSFRISWQRQLVN
jgi:hypothetical protein